jgi:isopenicillin N synthase-like dioxygenase
MANGRPYMMDPHIDGQLLTFIAQTEQGLMVGEPDSLSPVAFSSSDLFIMAGKLLEFATDGEIKGLLHAVGHHAGASDRLSLMYFQNPSFTEPPYPSLRTGRPIDFFSIADDIHTSYGNPSYKDEATQTPPQPA